MSSPTGTSLRRGKDKKREETPDENLEASDSYIQAREGALAVAKYFKLDVREDLDGQVTASAKKKTVRCSRSSPNPILHVLANIVHLDCQIGRKRRS